MNTLLNVRIPQAGERDLIRADAGHLSTKRATTVWWMACVVLAVVLLCLPFMHVVTDLGDRGVLIHGAERLLHGQKLYADFFEFLPPGGFIVVYAWFRLTEISIFSTSVLNILIIAGIASFAFLSCWTVSRNHAVSAILTILWVICSQDYLMQLNHHWLATLFVMVTAWALLACDGRARRWPFLAGVAAGAAAMVVPTRGALAMLAGAVDYLRRRRDRYNLFTFVLTGTLVPVCLILYLAWQGTLTVAFDDVILWAATRYAPIQYVPFGKGVSRQALPLVFIFPAAALLLLCGRVTRTIRHERKAMLCVVFGVTGFAGCFPRPDIFHIAYNAPLILPLVALCATQVAGRWRPALRMVAATAALVLCLPSTYDFAMGAVFVSNRDTIVTPRGRIVWAGPPGMPEMLTRIAALPLNDGYFFYPSMAMAPFVTARADVTKYDYFAPGYTLPAQYRDACLDATRRASWVIIDRHATEPSVLKFNFPSMRDPRPAETAAFEQALDRAFDLVARDGALELLHRRTAIATTICDEISIDGRSSSHGLSFYLGYPG